MHLTNAFNFYQTKSLIIFLKLIVKLKMKPNCSVTLRNLFIKYCNNILETQL